MGKVRRTEYKAAAKDHRIGCDPVDQNEQWQAIYAILKANIGDHHAYNWFGHCRFLAVHNDSIRLEHWGAWLAREALNRHGLALCKAAGVSKALIRYHGGTVPQGCTGRKVDGFAEYAIPVGRSREFRRAVAGAAMDAVVAAAANSGGRTAWMDRTDAARREDVAFIKTLKGGFLEIYCRGIGTTPEEIRMWALTDNSKERT